MNILWLKLKNFRKFSETIIGFHPGFTVLAGDNASGKTQILDAVSILLSSYILDFGLGAARHIKTNDVKFKIYEENELVYKEEQYPVSLSAAIEFRDDKFIIDRALNGKKSRTTWTGAKQLKSIGADDLEKLKTKSEEVTLPIMAYYGTGRLWHMKRHIDTGKKESRAAGYQNCLDPHSDHLEFQEWFISQELAALQKRKPISALEAVRSAVRTVITDCKNFYYDAQHKDITVVFNDDSFCPFDSLSDGYRSMVAMVADIAHRAARLNPHLGEKSALETSGIVLIDEIDLHLHPKWQRKIVRDLQAAFPGVQFIATTHSPFIIQSLKPDELLDLNSLDTVQNKHLKETGIAYPGPASEYADRSIEDIAEDIMGVDIPQRSSRYQKMYEAAKEYYSVLQKAGTADENTKEELKRKLDELSAPFSDNIAYHAFLEMERMSAGLGKSSGNNGNGEK